MVSISDQCLALAGYLLLILSESITDKEKIGSITNVKLVVSLPTLQMFYLANLDTLSGTLQSAYPIKNVAFY